MMMKLSPRARAAAHRTRDPFMTEDPHRPREFPFRRQRLRPILAGAILLVLLTLELADRVTMKWDLEIAREIQSWLM